MASTNKTIHYDLSQYTANDKPTYLVDYNTDMANIDQGIYDADSLARTNESAIGTMANLDTADKSSLVGAINEVNTGKNNNASNIGNLSNLTTDTTSTLVGAINEVDSHADVNASNIGVMANLNTTVKSSLVGAINEVLSEIPDVYSTSEIKTEKVWIDNKPIYHKVFTFSSLNNGSANEVGQISNIDHAIHLEGIVSESGDKLALPYADNRNIEWNIGLSINIDTNNLGKIIIQKGGYGTVNGDCHVIVEYTKTTD